MHHGVHLLFSILTLGLWAVSWFAIYVSQHFRPWRCEHCRWQKPEFREGGDGMEEPKTAAEAAGGRGSQ